MSTDPALQHLALEGNSPRREGIEQDMTRKMTARGFDIYAEFIDRYGTAVRIQQSSLATEPAVWIFSEGGDPHLTVRMAGVVRDALDEFIRDNA